jgi:uncharacterized protein (TIGR00255 family)
MLTKKSNLSSMTGIGHARFIYQHKNFELIAKSVNSRGLDIHIRIPKELAFLEADFYSQVQKNISRGRVDISLNSDGQNQSMGAELEFNNKQAELLIKNIAKFAKNYPEITNKISFGDLLSNNFLIEKSSWKPDNIFKNHALKYLAVALKDLQKARLFEGNMLSGVLSASLRRCQKLIKNITKRADADIKKRFRAITNRVNELFLPLNINQERLLQECALLAERADFKEEIDRLIAHCEHFAKLCHEKVPKGRRLDFLCQEMLRESNTLLTKAFEHEVITQAIELKAEIERLREQVQNIE